MLKGTIPAKRMRAKLHKLKLTADTACICPLWPWLGSMVRGDAAGYGVLGTISRHVKDFRVLPIRLWPFHPFRCASACRRDLACPSLPPNIRDMKDPGITRDPGSAPPGPIRESGLRAHSHGDHYFSHEVARSMGEAAYPRGSAALNGNVNYDTLTHRVVSEAAK
jgi:hypothetical protein